MILLDGKKISKKIEVELKKEIELLDHKLKLSVILVGNNPASITYINMKKKKCLELGIDCEIIQLDENANQLELMKKIDDLNKNDKVTGILVQLPIPNHMNTREALDRVSIEKDVDGFHVYNLGNLFVGNNKIAPCTPKGIIRLLEGVDIEGKHAVVVGRSNIVGKPLALLLLQKNATVTVCHSRTKNLGDITNQADILVAAVGKPKMITANMVKEGAIVIDVGINKTDEGLVGDVDFENVKDKCSYITPVPGGIGPMTIISLIENLIILKKLYK